MLSGRLCDGERKEKKRAMKPKKKRASFCLVQAPWKPDSRE